MSIIPDQLVTSIIYYYRHNSIVARNNEQEALLKSWTKQLDPVIQTDNVRELSQKISDDINRKKYSLSRIHDMMLNTLDIIIDKGNYITWGRIVISFAFIACVAQQCDQLDLEHITQIFIEHVTKSLNAWIINNGGWNYFVKPKGIFDYIMELIFS